MTQTTEQIEGILTIQVPIKGTRTLDPNTMTAFIRTKIPSALASLEVKDFEIEWDGEDELPSYNFWQITHFDDTDKGE